MLKSDSVRYIWNDEVVYNLQFYTESSFPTNELKGGGEYRSESSLIILIFQWILGLRRHKARDEMEMSPVC
jgi:hypothetical protein